jgi:DNA-directed RNA polymerase beta subunit
MTKKEFHSPFGRATNERISHLLPELIDMQRESFSSLLKDGILEEFSKINPVKSSGGDISLIFYPKEYKLTPPGFTLREAIVQGKTYSGKLFIPARLSCIRDFKEDQKAHLVENEEKFFSKKEYSTKSSKENSSKVEIINDWRSFQKGGKGFQNQTSFAKRDGNVPSSGFSSVPEELKNMGKLSPSFKSFPKPDRFSLDFQTFEQSLDSKLFEKRERRFQNWTLKCWVLIGNLPLMTKRGHFIINGSPRVLVSQMTRCPGVYFHEKWRGIGSQKKRICYADFISRRGAWLRIQVDKNKDMSIRLKRTGKIPLDVFQEGLKSFERFNGDSSKIEAFKLKKVSTLPSTEGFLKKKETSRGKSFNPFFDQRNIKRYELDPTFSSTRRVSLQFGKDKKLTLFNSYPNLMHNPRSSKFPFSLVPSDYTWRFQDSYTSLRFAFDEMGNPNELLLEKKKKIDQLLKRFVITRDSGKKSTTGVITNLLDISGFPLHPKILGKKINGHSPFPKSYYMSRYGAAKLLSPSIFDFIIWGNEKQTGKKKTRGRKGKRKEKEYFLDFKNIHFKGKGFEKYTGSPLNEETFPPSLNEGSVEIDIRRFQPKRKKKSFPLKNRKRNDLSHFQRIPKRRFFETFFDTNVLLDFFEQVQDLGGRSESLPLLPHENGKNQDLLATGGLQFIYQKFKNPRSYDLGKVGREKINKKLEIFTANRQLNSKDIQFASLYLQKLENTEILGDDIDNLKNRRIRSAGELLQNQIETGIYRLERFVLNRLDLIFPKKLFWKESPSFSNKDLKKKRLPVSKFDILSSFLRSLVTTKPFNGALREFFGSNPLSQYMDQTNPLAEITHKRRISSLGPGGISRDTAGMAIRGIHATHYGRICPIETPEGKNAGLVNSLTLFGKNTQSGFLQTPYFKVYKGQVQKTFLEKDFSHIAKNFPFFFSADFEQEMRLVLAPGDLNLSHSDFLPAVPLTRSGVVLPDRLTPNNMDLSGEKESGFTRTLNAKSYQPLPVRIAGAVNDQFQRVEREVIQFIALSPLQMISVATSLIPFLEHDDANRALMGSNMQRQAVPIIRPDRPIVGTGLESLVIAESGQALESKKSGLVIYCSSERIVLHRLNSLKLLSSSQTPLWTDQFQSFLPLKLLNEPFSAFQYLKKEKDFLVWKIEKGLQRMETKKCSFLKKFAYQDVYQLDIYQRSNQETCLTHRPSIYEGDWVQKGDVLADCSASLGGELALGKNLMIAYLPWEGYNFEDALVASQRLVSEDLFTSLHIEKHDVEISESKKGLDIISGDIPYITYRERQKLDSFGIIKIGQWVEEGDILVGKIASIKPKPLSPHQKLAFDLAQLKPSRTKDTSLRVPKGVHGRVIKVEILETSQFPNSQDESFALEEERFLKKILTLKEKRYKKHFYSFLRFQKSNETKKRFHISLLNRNRRDNFQRKSLPAFPLPLSSSSAFFSSFLYLSLLNTSTFQFPIQFLSKYILLTQWFNLKDFFQFQQEINKTFFVRYLLKKRDNHFFSKQKRFHFFSFELLESLADSFFFSNWYSLWFSKKLTEIKSLKKGRSFLSTLEDSLSLKEKTDFERKTENLSSQISLDIFLPFPNLLKRITREENNFEKFEKEIIVFQKVKKRRNIWRFQTSLFLELEEKKVLTKGQKLAKSAGFVQRVSLPLAFSGLAEEEERFPTKIRVYLAEKRKIQVGDKVAGRHGNKGILSILLGEWDMPYLPNGRPLDMILNPLGVPSRMNVGQVFECLLGLAGDFLNQQYKITPFDEMYGAETSRSLVYLKLYQARLKSGQHWLFYPKKPGKTRLTDGRTGEPFNQFVTVGSAYIIKLIHLVDEKIHARSTGPYSLITKQPLGGRSKHGGQRLGEMEVWALEGFGAAYTLQEMLTNKSDDVLGRQEVLKGILSKRGSPLGNPEAFKVLIRELQSLCLDIRVSVLTGLPMRRKRVDISQVP